jgi:hypothetical protein
VPIVSHSDLRPIICAKKCLLDADQVIAEQKIVLVNLASGSPALFATDSFRAAQQTSVGAV